MKIFVQKGKLSHSSEMQNDALMHREGLKGSGVENLIYFSAMVCKCI